MSEIIKITLPDGTQREYPKGTTALDIAKSIGAGLARDALAARSRDEWIDLRKPLEEDMPLRLITTRDADGVEVIRHSAEHIMADAVKQLWPTAKVDVGRSDHSEKFQYDFDVDHPFSIDDLAKIEAKMQELINADTAFTLEQVPRDEAKKLFAELGEDLKVSRIDDIKADQKISLYRHGTGFVDLCRGPHVQRTGQVKAIKLLDVSGSYWRGDEKNKKLQRIYGTAFAKKEDLGKWELLREEAEKRDHRRLGKDLDLFSIQDGVGGGLVLWHPQGAMVRKLMEDYWRAEHMKRGYGFVNTPHVGRAALWQTSGHLGFYKDSMFASMEIEGDPYYCKPMNCPFHVMIFDNKRHSYRELPLRFAELGTVYRYERSGVLHGLMRVRGFTQDDSHIFCTPEQVEQEIMNVTEFALKLLRTFGFTEFEAFISTKPEKSVGEPEHWDKATAALKSAAEKIKLPYQIDEGGGAFYGPKIDIKIKDAIGRFWQCSTIQFDFNLPERFNITYVGADNKPHRPYMVHRALFGSLERFFGVLIEHHAGAFPLWLSPVQARLLPVTDRAQAYAEELQRMFAAQGLRVEVDGSKEKLGYKVREAQMLKIPFACVIGDREVDQGGLSPRRRGGEDLKFMTPQDFVSLVKGEVEKEMNV